MAGVVAQWASGHLVITHMCLCPPGSDCRYRSEVYRRGGLVVQGYRRLGGELGLGLLQAPPLPPSRWKAGQTYRAGPIA